MIKIWTRMMTKEVLMARPARGKTRSAVKRDPLSTRGGKVPTGKVSGMKPPNGGSTPSSNGSGAKK